MKANIRRFFENEIPPSPDPDPPEVREAILSMKSGKPPGSDGFPDEYYKKKFGKF